MSSIEAVRLNTENCNSREVAALLLLLSHDLAQHGFRLGLGKALGMGNVVSRIHRVWVRNARDYTWQELEVPSADALTPVLEMLWELNNRRTHGRFQPGQTLKLHTLHCGVSQQLLAGFDGDAPQLFSDHRRP